MVTRQQVQKFLEVRKQAAQDTERYQQVRESLLAGDKAEVLAHFEALLQLGDDEERAGAIDGLAALYGAGAIDSLIRWINDSSPTVRAVVCVCLQDHADRRVEAALRDRLKQDADCQVRGIAANALGHCGAVEALPDLYQTWKTDHEVDELGHSPSDSAVDAITSVLRSWVTRQIQGTPPLAFRESTRNGELIGTVTAEAIALDAEGGIYNTPRYASLPRSAFDSCCSCKLDLQTSLAAPFEIDVQYVDSTCEIRRLLIYQPITDLAEFTWAVHAILNPSEMKASSES